MLTRQTCFQQPCSPAFVMQHSRPSGYCRLPLPVLATATRWDLCGSCRISRHSRHMLPVATHAQRTLDHSRRYTEPLLVTASKLSIAGCPCAQQTTVFITTHRTCSSVLHTGFVGTPAQATLKPSSIGREGGMAAHCKMSKQAASL